MQNIVMVDSLVKYNGVPAVDGVSFNVSKDEVFSLLGHNGAGKTTTIEIIGCVRTLTSGSVNVLGYDITKPGSTKEIKKHIGVLPQDFSTFENLTV